MFSQVTFKDNMEGVGNLEFFRITTNEIVPIFTGNDASVSFNKLKIKKKDWSDLNPGELRDEPWIKKSAKAMRE